MKMYEYFKRNALNLKIFKNILYQYFYGIEATLLYSSSHLVFQWPFLCRGYLLWKIKICVNVSQSRQDISNILKMAIFQINIFVSCQCFKPYCRMSSLYSHYLDYSKTSKNSGKNTPNSGRQTLGAGSMKLLSGFLLSVVLGEKAMN